MNPLSQTLVAELPIHMSIVPWEDGFLLLLLGMSHSVYGVTVLLYFTLLINLLLLCTVDLP